MKTLTWLIICGLAASIFIYINNQSRLISRIVFCDVGQGDAIYLRLDSQIDVLIDSGPYSQVISCLNEEMPLFDRTIELAFLTHPEKDHFGGFVFLLDSFKIQTLYLPVSVKNALPSTKPWRQFWQKAKIQIANIDYLAQNDQITNGANIFTILAPITTSTTDFQTLDYNNLALGILAQVRDKQILLLSDLDILPAEKAIEQLNLNVNIFKVNHHGSKYGLSQRLLKLADPAIAVISVGRENWYGHPHLETIRLLQSLNIPIKRTDKQGKIVLKL